MCFLQNRFKKVAVHLTGRNNITRIKHHYIFIPQYFLPCSHFYILLFSSHHGITSINIHQKLLTQIFKQLYLIQIWFHLFEILHQFYLPGSRLAVVVYSLIIHSCFVGGENVSFNFWCQAVNILLTEPLDFQCSIMQPKNLDVDLK